jgi:hypothetical protein
MIKTILISTENVYFCLEGSLSISPLEMSSKRRMSNVNGHSNSNSKKHPTNSFSPPQTGKL